MFVNLHLSDRTVRLVHPSHPSGPDRTGASLHFYEAAAAKGNLNTIEAAAEKKKHYPIILYHILYAFVKHFVQINENFFKSIEKS